jgi:hypothetical protein
MTDRQFTTADLINLVLASVAGGAISNIINIADIPEWLADTTGSNLFWAWTAIFTIVSIALLWRF